MKLQTAKGVQDYAPEEKIVRNEVVAILKEVFERYGFPPLETPILERYETLAAKFAAGTGSDIMKEIFKLKDQGKRELGLRYDLTVPLARFMGMNPNLKMPFKRYEIGNVFRDGPIKAGRVRQFCQCDADIVGTNSVLADAEILAVVQMGFNKLKLNVIIKVNNRKLLNGILEVAGIKKKEEAITAVDKLDKIGEKRVKKELKEKGFDSKKITSLLKLLKNKNLNLLKKQIKSKEGQEGIRELEELFSYLKAMKVKVEFDPSLARGLAYYTGTVFEVFLKSGKFTSSLAGGGRWDKMIGSFLGGDRDIPAVGVAFGLVPLMEALRLENRITKKTIAKVYVVPINTIKESLKVVQQLREAGIPTDFSLAKKGVSKNLEYANKLRIPYVILIGERELSSGSATVRNMESGIEAKVKISKLVNYFRNKLQ